MGTGSGARLPGKNPDVLHAVAPLYLFLYLFLSSYFSLILRNFRACSSMAGSVASRSMLDAP